MLQREKRRHRLDTARRGHGVADERLGRAHQHAPLAEDARHGQGLDTVVLGRACPMRVDVADVARLAPRRDEMERRLTEAVGAPVTVKGKRAEGLGALGRREGIARGEHAHRKLHQMLVCLTGSVTAEVDDGSARSTVLLDCPHVGLYMGPMVWGAQHHYSRDAVLLALASHEYDPADYIRDYDAFLAAVRAG